MDGLQPARQTPALHLHFARVIIPDVRNAAADQVMDLSLIFHDVKDGAISELIQRCSKFISGDM